MGFDGKMGLGNKETRRLQVVRDAVAQTVSIARLASRSRDRVGEELTRLGALQELARLSPIAWRQAAQERRDELAFWLFNAAIGLAATGEHAAAAALLNALPGVPAGAQGRRELLLELCAQDSRLAA